MLSSWASPVAPAPPCAGMNGEMTSRENAGVQSVFQCLSPMALYPPAQPRFFTINSTSGDGLTAFGQCDPAKARPFFRRDCDMTCGSQSFWQSKLISSRISCNVASESHWPKSSGWGCARHNEYTSSTRKSCVKKLFTVASQAVINLRASSRFSAG